MTTNAEEFIAQYIAEQNPEIDLTENTPFYDLFVRFPSVTYLNQILTLRDQSVANRSLANTAVATEEYDELLANWFFDRITATNTYVTSRYIFSSRPTLSVNENSVFTVGGISFRPLYNQFISQSLYKQLDTNEATQYYLDIELVSNATGAATAVALDATVIPPFASEESYIAGSVLGVSSIGNDAETNDLALNRLRAELGTRTLVNLRGIAASLSDLFPGVVLDSYVAGYAEPEQLRDKISVEIPKRNVRLYFKSKLNLLVPQGTVFNYNDNPTIRYSLTADLNVADTSTLWQSFGIYFFVEASVRLLDLSNPEGFVEDKDITSTYLTTNFPLTFVSAITRTTSAGTSLIRTGGKSDLYLKVPVERRLLELDVPADSGGFLDIPEDLRPLIKLHSVSKRDGLLVTPLDIYDLSTGQPKYRYSSLDDTQIFVDPGVVGTKVIIDASFSPFVRLVNGALNDPSERVIGEDILARYMNPIYMDIYMIVAGDPSIRDALAASVIRHVNDIPAGSDFVLSNMLASLRSDVDQLAAIFFDTVNVLATHYMPDGTEIRLEEADVIKPHEDLSLGVSARNSTFIVDRVEIVFVN